MYRVQVKYNDGYKITYKCRNGLEDTYANRHVKDRGVKSIVVHKYPLQNNKPVDWLNQSKGVL